MQAVQVKMARAALGLTGDQLASKAGISPFEVTQMESVGASDSEAANKLRMVFEEAGIEWIGEDGVRLAAPTQDASAIAVEDLNSYNDE